MGKRIIRRYRAGDAPMPTLVLIRHGQSAWNLENRFTGWWDVDVTEKGVEEARAAGRLMAEKGLDFDQCYTSLQTRAIKTLNLALEEMGRLWLPVEKDWRLNERHYGGLTGLNKAETAEKHGEEQVKIWRRSFDTPPPAMEAGSAFDLSADRRYAGIDVPMTESLKDTIARVLPYWNSVIAPDLKAGKRVLISAHGNSLRALVKHLSGISDDEITGLEIPTGRPIVYELADDLTATDRYYLSER
jgi:2,3-bisphosphoglycerate-dependent phosphoglycerate mutase